MPVRILIPTPLRAYADQQASAQAPASTVEGALAELVYYRKLADILNSIRGLYVHSDRNYSYLGVRGFGSLGSYNSRVLVMVDGYRQVPAAAVILRANLNRALMPGTARAAATAASLRFASGTMASVCLASSTAPAFT